MCVLVLLSIEHGSLWKGQEAMSVDYQWMILFVVIIVGEILEKNHLSDQSALQKYLNEWFWRQIYTACYIILYMVNVYYNYKVGFRWKKHTMSDYSPS